ncbi:topless-related protein 2-like [Trifolium medium]|uniref:Topless-related protein 2-like n=1 Tax=Trifolium medium TaxID=97028 RepID=A0A392MDS1_9FABA|nr:topless-related protein 2-like [Trifolium medium]
MGSMNQEMVLLDLQFLREENMKETLHRMEQESGFYLNLKYFNEKILAGDLDECEKYLNGFTKMNENRSSMKMFFEMRKQKHFEVVVRLCS